MADVHTPEARSRNMQAISSRDTKPEVHLRRLLHARGFRFRLHVKTLPGKPDVVFPKLHAVIQIHGCFWHGHDCYLFKWPKSRREFWESKINANRSRDERANQSLRELGWRILIVWECALKGRLRQPEDTLIGEIELWLRGDSVDVNSQYRELRCINPRADS